MSIEQHIHAFIPLKNIQMLATSLGLSYTSQAVCVLIYLCKFNETHTFMLWVLANNVCMHGVRCLREPCDTTLRTLTPQECVLTSTSILTPHCAYTSRYLFLPQPVQEHHVWHVVAQSLWHCHAQSVQGVMGGTTWGSDTGDQLICCMLESPSNLVLNMGLTTTGANTAHLWDVLRFPLALGLLDISNLRQRGAQSRTPCSHRTGWTCSVRLHEPMGLHSRNRRSAECLPCAPLAHLLDWWGQSSRPCVRGCAAESFPAQTCRSQQQWWGRTAAQGICSCWCTCGAQTPTAGVRLHAGHEPHFVTKIRLITVDCSHLLGSALSTFLCDRALPCPGFECPFWAKQNSAV